MLFVSSSIISFICNQHFLYAFRFSSVSNNYIFSHKTRQQRDYIHCLNNVNIISVFYSLFYNTPPPSSVLQTWPTIAGAIIPAGFTLPYWLLYAIILTGINCKEEIFKIKNVDISLLATLPLFPFADTGSSPPLLP